MTRPSEEWRPVLGYEGRYEVSSEGRVRSLLTSRVLRDFEVARKGYRGVSLSTGVGRAARKRVHRLMLEAFVGPCPPGLEACHENDVPDDNRLANLRWDTPKENGRDRRGATCRKGHLRTPENALVQPDGSLRCRICRRANEKKHRKTS